MRGERGSGSIVVAGILVVVVVTAMGLADVARTLVAASRAQTAADAAALAAAQTLAFPSGEEVPADVARILAERNGAALITCACDAPALEATVTVEVPVGRLLLGSDDRSVTARARAIVDVPVP